MSVRTAGNRVKNWNGTVHYADLDGTPACGPVATADSWLAPSVATVTCQKCIAHFGEDEPGHVDPEPQNESATRRAAERAARREARSQTTTPEGDEMDESPAEELGRLRRELTEYDPETPEYRMIRDRTAVLAREAAEARGFKLRAAAEARFTFRDATYNAVTQERLVRLLRALTSEDGWNQGERGEEVRALADVVERWDANEATETTL